MASTTNVMSVSQLWRHPVKSFQGERITETVVETDGIAHDRAYGVKDLSSGRLLSAKTEAKLLFAKAIIDDEDQLCLDLDGTVLRGIGPATDRAVSAFLGKKVAVVAARDEDEAFAEAHEEALDDRSSLRAWQLPTGRFVDSSPLLLITTATLRAGAGLHRDGRWDVRRFRPNIVVDAPGTGWLEDKWPGLKVRIGEVLLSVRKPCFRCVMITRAQGGLERDVEIYRSIAHEHQTTFGVLCFVDTPGRVREGDDVEVLNDELPRPHRA